MDILSSEIANAYLEAPCGDKPWTVSGKEFGSLAGTPIRTNPVFYGIKSAVNSWHKALSTTLSNVNFEPSREDPDNWLRMPTNSRGENYRECIVVYVDNLLAII